MGRHTVIGSKSYEAVLSAIEDRLRSGRLRIGDRLPSERAMAEEFGISRNSVREAVRVLDAMGLVRSGVGSGPSAGAVVISEPSAALGWGLRMHLASHFLPVADVVSTRMTLESQAAAAAAERVGSDAEDPDPAGAGSGASDSGTAVGSAPRAADLLARATGVLDAMDDPDLPDERFHDLDARFHLLISSLGGNVVVTTILDSLRQATVGYVQEGVLLLQDWPAVRVRLQAQHREILAAVAQSDAARAASAVRDHVAWFHRTAFDGV